MIFGEPQRVAWLLMRRSPSNVISGVEFHHCDRRGASSAEHEGSNINLETRQPQRLKYQSGMVERQSHEFLRTNYRTALTLGPILRDSLNGPRRMESYLLPSSSLGLYSPKSMFMQPRNRRMELKSRSEFCLILSWVMSSFSQIWGK